MTFSLCLADKQCWRFQAEAPLHDWLIKFATVLSLRTDVLSSTMTITFRIRNRDAAALPMPMYDFGILALRPDGSAAGWFCDIDTAFEGDFIIDRMIYALYAVYRETVRHEGLPFHAGLVEKGRGRHPPRRFFRDGQVYRLSPVGRPVRYLVR